ncbi:S-layer homology domain-containing protein [uncultured Neglectibacter sp.]|uniref:S-layer homology domain-containing protein n=1 Tax=uncultured Neglectibacter sp. TaxID=1924108 RepID=UPI0034DF376F
MTCMVEFDGEAFEKAGDIIPNALARNSGATSGTGTVAITAADAGAYAGKTLGGTLQNGINYSAWTEAGGKVKFLFGYSYADNNQQKSATGTDWDYVIPFRAKKTVTRSEFKVSTYTTGGTKLGGVSGTGNAIAGGMQIMKNANASGKCQDTYTTADNDANIEGVSTFVTVTSNDPEIDIVEKTLDPVADQEVVVSISKNGKFASNIAATDFKIVDSTGSAVPSAPAVKIKGTAAGASTATLQIAANDTNLAANTNYKIKVDANKVLTSGGDPMDENPATSYLTSAKTFKIKPAITGTSTISGTAKYGETLTATHNTNATSPKYQWYRGTTKITGATNATYKLTLADVDQTIKVEVTDTALYGKAESAATAAVGKITLTAPAAAGITNVPAILQNATDKTKTGIYTFVAGNGIINSDVVTVSYTATYADVSTAQDVNDVSVALGTTLAGAGAKGYTFAGATVTGVKGTVSPAGYALPATTTDGKTITWGSGKNHISTPSDTSTGTITLTAGEKLTGLTASVGTVSITDADAGTFTYTAPAGAITGLTNVTFTASSASETTLTVTIADKNYDGTKTITDDMITVTGGVAGAEKADFGITASYADETAADGKTATITGTKTEIKVGDTTYKLPATTTGNIKPIDAAVSVNTGTGKIASDATIEQVLTAIKGAAVTVAGVEKTQGTVGDYFTTDSKISDAIKAAYPAVYTAADPGKQPSTETLTNTDAEVQAADELVKGTKFILPADATVGGAALTEGESNGLRITKAADTGLFTVEVTGDVTDAVEIKFNSDANKLTIPAGKTTIDPVEATEEGWDFSSLAGSSIEIELDLSTADVTTGVLFTNVANASSKKLAVTAPINRKGVPASSGVSFDTLGFGKAEYDTADLNSDNKLDALPKVTPKVGLEFRGWSTDGTEAHLVTAETYKPDAEGENTLTAVFRGYMVGNEKSEVRPTANITRKELAKVLVIAAGVYDKDVDYTKDPANLFPDMPHDGWSDNYVACAKKNGIMKGNDLGKGTPNAQITREEAAAMIARVFGVKTSTTDTTDKVNDFDKVSGWAKEYVAALCNNGTINGKPDGSFSGKMNIQRAEAAKMTNIYLGLDDAKKEAIKGDSSIKNPFPDLKGDAMWAYSDLMFASKSVPATFYSDKITVPEAK